MKKVARQKIACVAKSTLIAQSLKMPLKSLGLNFFPPRLDSIAQEINLEQPRSH